MGTHAPNMAIWIDPNVHFGKPCVVGTRIPVRAVQELAREGLSFETIIRDFYPDLTTEDVRACVQHAINVLAAEDRAYRHRRWKRAPAAVRVKRSSAAWSYQ